MVAIFHKFKGEITKNAEKINYKPIPSKSYMKLPKKIYRG